MSGKQIGYLRVSTLVQNTARQLDGVVLDKVFEDKASGKDADRPQLMACLDYCREGDTLHVHSMDRLARNLDDMRRIVKDLTGRGCNRSISQGGARLSRDDSPMNTLLLSMLGAVVGVPSAH